MCTKMTQVLPFHHQACGLSCSPSKGRIHFQMPCYADTSPPLSTSFTFQNFSPLATQPPNQATALRSLHTPTGPHGPTMPLVPKNPSPQSHPQHPRLHWPLDPISPYPHAIVPTGPGLAPPEPIHGTKHSLVHSPRTLSCIPGLSHCPSSAATPISFHLQ